MRTFIFLLLVSASLQMSGQITHFGNKYLYEGKVYKKNELGYILSQDPDAFYNYQKWQHSNKGIPIVLLGAAITIWGFSLTHVGEDEGFIDAIFGPIFGIPITIGGLSTMAVGGVLMRKNDIYLDYSIRIFNDTDTSGFIPKEKLKIDFGYDEGNVGLFVTF